MGSFLFPEPVRDGARGSEREYIPMRRMALRPVVGHELRFTKRWFLNRNLPTFRELIYPLWSGKSMLYLEVGVYEGMSLIWMMQYVLTHPDSRAIGVDPWLMSTKLDGAHMEAVRERAFHNLLPWRDRCELVRGNSSEVLRKMLRRQGWLGVRRDSVDLCMIDGDHHGLLVLDDARLCLQLVKPGGWIVFDDVENDRKKREHVKQGLEMFLKESGDRVKQLWKHRYMEAFEKL